MQMGRRKKEIGADWKIYAGDTNIIGGVVVGSSVSPIPNRMTRPHPFDSCYPFAFFFGHHLLRTFKNIFFSTLIRYAFEFLFLSHTGLPDES